MDVLDAAVQEVNICYSDLLLEHQASSVEGVAEECMERRYESKKHRGHRSPRDSLTHSCFTTSEPTDTCDRLVQRCTNMASNKTRRENPCSNEGPTTKGIFR